MKADDVKRLLQQEEQRRRQRAKSRDRQVLQLMREQADDNLGKLWGEESFGSIASRKDQAVDEVMAHYVPHFRTPEKMLLIKEMFSLVSQTIRTTFGDQAWVLFSDWLDRTTVAELAVERDVPFTTLLQQIRSMVLECRKRFGQTEKFPFEERGGAILKRSTAKRSLKRMLSGKSQAVNQTARVNLTEAEKNMSLDVLREHLSTKLGREFPRSTAYWTKKRGWYYPAKPGSLSGGGLVYKLTAKELRLTAAELVKQYGISSTTAYKAKKRGYFVVNSQNAHTVTFSPSAPKDDSGNPAV